MACSNNNKNNNSDHYTGGYVLKNNVFFSYLVHLPRAEPLPPLYEYVPQVPGGDDSAAARVHPAEGVQKLLGDLLLVPEKYFLSLYDTLKNRFKPKKAKKTIFGRLQPSQPVGGGNSSK